ncbi:tetratricopeptide repeat protein [Luteococcus peritonei]|uniref:Tetratricopeptide repeat protein n=1 Tax=Luteococcus peritonei TaxID=88874 RepID=A0ABW4RZV5_9ACTN
MTSESFSRPGAIDLSQLASAAGTDPANHAGPVSTGAGAGAWVQQVGEADFDAVARKSVNHPVIMELYSPRAGAQELSDILIRKTAEAGGRWLLARVNVDVESRVAQALGVQAVPTVVALVGGQLVPLFQGTKGEDEVQNILDQVVQMSVANGLTGRAEPVNGAAPAAEGEPAEKPADPRFAAADAALEQGDYATAVTEFEKVLAQTPGDAEATQGLAQSRLLQRSLAFDPQAIVTTANAEPENWAVQMDAADLELINGDPAAAFDRLLQIIRETREDEREAARVRLLELFDVVGKAEPTVVKARRQLSSALF